MTKRLWIVAATLAVVVAIGTATAAWRKLEGYEVGIPEYEVQYLGHKPHGYNEATEQ